MRPHYETWGLGTVHGEIQRGHSDVTLSGTSRYVKESVEEVGKRGGEAWLLSLEKQPYHQAWAELCQLPGVGAKVSHVNTIHDGCV